MVRTTTDDATDESNDDDLTAIAEWAIELSKRAGDGDSKNPVEMAFGEASNDEDTVSVRIGATRDDRVDFRIRPATLYEDAYKPDQIIAEHFGHEAAIAAALEALRNDADLRSVREGGCGALRFDRDTGELVDVSLYGVDVADGTVDRIRTAFENAGSDE